MSDYIKMQLLLMLGIVLCSGYNAWAIWTGGHMSYASIAFVPWLVVVEIMFGPAKKPNGNLK